MIERQGMGMFRSIFLIFAGFTSIVACQPPSNKEDGLDRSITLKGEWIKDLDAPLMLDPQTSGLSFKNGVLYSISDGSADKSQIQQIHVIDPSTNKVIEKLGPIMLSERLKTSCFATYLSDRPDYEGIIALPDDDSFLLITEDASRTDELSLDCQKRFKDTGSTVYPTLLVKVDRGEMGLVASGVRAIQFADSDQIGNFPNDGIEGLALTNDAQLLLGLEKDANNKPRVFSLDYDHALFATLDDFLPVSDAGLRFPPLDDNNHPINGMEVLYREGQGYLVAAARNDDEIWIMDLKGNKGAIVLEAKFLAPSVDVDNCEAFHVMQYSAIEGVAIHENTLYLINDPWKKMYPENIVCEADESRYLKMAPLMFDININDIWFE